MKKALPPREKAIPLKPRLDTGIQRPAISGTDSEIHELAECHLFCAGDGCDARMGKRTTYEGGDGRRHDRITLEPRYTNEPHEKHAAGTWWRSERGGYTGMARNRDIRKAHGIPRSPSEDFLGPETQRTIRQAARVVLGEADSRNPRAMPRRDQYRPTLPPGVHIVACYECEGLTRIDNSRHSA